MNATGSTGIVVGVSGSPASVAALRWAADEAVRRDIPLHVVLVWGPEHRASYAPAHPGDSGQRSAQARRVLTTALQFVLGPMPREGVTMEIAEGTPERALTDRSAGAELLVLGSASAHALTGHSLGPVIRTCLRHAHCPVVIVGPEQDDQLRLAGATAVPVGG